MIKEIKSFKKYWDKGMRSWTFYAVFPFWMLGYLFRKICNKS